MPKYQEYKKLDLPAIDEAILAFWNKENIFQKSVDERSPDNPFVFYEGPPSANGKPGIHHVMARTVKDLFCRYHTMKGQRVERKGGWDTHGLPVELKVEKELGITKDDIGTKISVEDYNKECRAAVMRFKELWDDLTERWATGQTWMTHISHLKITILSRSGIYLSKCMMTDYYTKDIRSSPTPPQQVLGSALMSSICQEHIKMSATLLPSLNLN